MDVVERLDVLVQLLVHRRGLVGVGDHFDVGGAIGLLGRLKCVVPQDQRDDALGGADLDISLAELRQPCDPGRHGNTLSSTARFGPAGKIGS
jgi:hypothetical protein